jgi:hypothetical protein
MRDFEAEKTRVMLAIEGFKSEVQVALARAELNKAEIAATVAANDGTVKVFEAQIAGQIEPIKAISEANQAKASAYGSAVQSAMNDLQAQIMPEELNLKGIIANTDIAKAKSDIALEESKIAIEMAFRQLQLEVTTMSALAQGATQMVASSLNGVNVSSTFGWSAGADTRYTGNLP